MKNRKQSRIMEKIRGRSRLCDLLILVIFGIFINIAGSKFAADMGLPIYLDTIGTTLTAVLGGYLPAVMVGLVSNMLKSMFDPASIYYGFLNVLIAVACGYLASKKGFDKWYKALVSAFCLAIIGGALGSVFTWFLYGFATEGVSAEYAAYIHQATNIPRFWAQMSADYVIDLVDKLITVAIVFALKTLLPNVVKDNLRFDGWQQKPLSKEAQEKVRLTKIRLVSLRTKILLLLVVAPLFVAVVSTSISYVLFRQSSVDEHTNLAKGVASLAASVIDPDKVENFLTEGDAADGYAQTERLLYSIRESSPDIEYVYVYKIMEDGCHVVFDLDTDELEGEEPGTVIQFDESFVEDLPLLLAGQPIEPIITDDTYGWLLTVYQPVYNDAGQCVCYAAADVSMEQLRANSYTFFAKLISLFLGFFIMIMVLGMWMAEYNIIMPVNSMAYCAGAFAYNSDRVREESVESIQKLDIHTGDEIENLYHSFAKTTEESMQYVADIQHQSQTISKMQNGLIMVLADMVESRDKCTGDHVRKTAAYTRIIMESLKKKGYYADELTDEFVYDVFHSAPLHDVGKIKVRDAILNKPGRLDDEEFKEMKQHAMSGSEIIRQAIEIVPESGYLNEAKNLAEFHHEKWDGSGYPHGITAEEIPLSARIMAVADVFDALVSRRSYKKPFSFEDAMGIIRDGAGKHFDPKVVEAFMDASEEVKKVADEFELTNKELIEDTI